MLKIKDAIDLKGLENYGFFKIELRHNENIYSTLYRKYTLTTYNDYDEAMIEIDSKTRVIRLFQKDLDGIEYLDTLYDLIKAGIVEKVK